MTKARSDRPDDLGEMLLTDYSVRNNDLPPGVKKQPVDKTLNCLYSVRGLLSRWHWDHLSVVRTNQSWQGEPRISVEMGFKASAQI